MHLIILLTLLAWKLHRKYNTCNKIYTENENIWFILHFGNFHVLFTCVFLAFHWSFNCSFSATTPLCLQLVSPAACLPAAHLCLCSHGSSASSARFCLSCVERWRDYSLFTDTCAFCLDSVWLGQSGPHGRDSHLSAAEVFSLSINSSI